MLYLPMKRIILHIYVFMEVYEMDNNNIPEEYRPISMWGYFGYEILFSIPIVGFICLIVFAIGAKNVNKKNFARSYFCYTIIVCLIAIVIFAIMMATGAASSLSQQGLRLYQSCQ